MSIGETGFFGLDSHSIGTVRCVAFDAVIMAVYMNVLSRLEEALVPWSGIPLFGSTCSIQLPSWRFLLAVSGRRRAEGG